MACPSFHNSSPIYHLSLITCLYPSRPFSHSLNLLIQSLTFALPGGTEVFISLFHNSGSLIGLFCLESPPSLFSHLNNPYSSFKVRAVTAISHFPILLRSVTLFPPPVSMKLYSLLLLYSLILCLYVMVLTYTV